MFVRKIRHRFGNIGVVVAEKVGGKMRELAAIGVAHSENGVDGLAVKVKPHVPLCCTCGFAFAFLWSGAGSYPRINHFTISARECFLPYSRMPVR